MDIKIVTLQDDLNKIVTNINQSQWDEANEISEYTVTALKAYLARQDTIFMVCYENLSNGSELAGIASSRVELKPYGEEYWLYVDEIDVCADKRKRGVGAFIMQHLLEIAKEKGCEELWLGTETDNSPANALYKSLDPDDVLDFVGYTYET